MFKKSTRIVILIGLVGLFFACEEDRHDLEKSQACQKKTSLEQLSFDKFLSFSSFDELEKELGVLSELSYEEQIAKEEKQNFVSIDRIYEEINLAEEELLKPYEDLNEDELAKMPRITSKTHDMYADILLTDTLEGGWLFEVPDAYSKYSKVLNRQSLVKVDGKIFQFKRDVTKIIEDGDASKIKYLSNITNTDTNLRITVLKFYPETNVYKHAYKTNGVYRVDLENRFKTERFDSKLFASSFYYKITVKKKAFGLHYIRHKPKKITFGLNLSGNTVNGFRRGGNGWVAETHCWNNGVTRYIYSYIYDDYFVAAPYNKNVLWYFAHLHYNDANNLPRLDNVRNNITVVCSKNRTISFTMNY